AVGQAVEQLYADRLGEYAATLGRHFAEAGDKGRALDYYHQAGVGALDAYANQEAESHFRHALALAATKGQRATLLSGLGEALYRQGRFDESFDAWRRAIEIHRIQGNSDGMASLYARSARAAWYAHETPEGLRLCLEGLEAVAGAPPSRAQAALLHEAARAYYFNGQPEQARPLCLQALEMAEPLGAVDVQADALATLGILPNQPPEEVLAALKKAVELAEGAGLLAIAGRAHHNLAIMTGNLTGDLQKAYRHSLRAVEIARQRGVVSEEVPSQLNAINHALVLGELEEAHSALLELEEKTRSAHDPDSAQLELRMMYAGLARQKGDWTEALRLYRLARTQAQGHGNLQLLLSINADLASLLLELECQGMLEDWGEAEALLDESMGLVDRGLGNPIWPRCELSIIRARQGRMDEARQFLAEARQLAEQHHHAWIEDSLGIAAVELARAEGNWSRALVEAEAVARFEASRGLRSAWARSLQERAEIHLQRDQPGDLERAQALLREARDTFHEMGATGYVTLTANRLEALRTQSYARALADGRAAQELAIAARIQSGLLPARVPQPRGWELAAVLEPARQTSGDFYDFIPLSGGNLGLVVADVADKGAGAALYMALSRTMIRSCAAEHDELPAQALRAVNQRILTETDTDMFVTVFYGVLDTESGTLTYCNAGHNPPYLLRGTDYQRLERTGMALGVVEDAALDQATVQI
ncbi:MAG: SpoIIE family protein phosphatase, partial [Anaerolineae bacterium]